MCMIARDFSDLFREVQPIRDDALDLDSAQDIIVTIMSMYAPAVNKHQMALVLYHELGEWTTDSPATKAQQFRRYLQIAFQRNAEADEVRPTVDSEGQ